MANKQLTAKVRLDTKSAEASLTRLARKINNVQSAINRTSKNNTKLTTAINKAVTSTNKLNTATNKVANTTNKVANTTKKINVANEQATKSAQRLGSAYRSSNIMAGRLLGTIKSLAATYLGIMGAKAIVNTTDTLVGAQNRLNYVSANQLGDGGFNADGTYSNETLNTTRDALDKIYVSSQKARTSYSDMMSNVSKTMTLAGDAFDNNIDNAIRFQEIMAEAYAVGGASAQEMSSSMYQLTQALGSGVLQGDELRSVREGAPLAYQAIEEFAQGVLNTDESLKDLASQGKITSEMVVAAIMNSGSAMDKAFAQTKQTFGQTFDQIRNSALYAFQPVMEMLSDMLNRAIDNGMVQRFEQFFTNVAKGVMIALRAIEKAINWIVDNWSWLQHILVAGLFVLAGMWIWQAGVAVASAIATILALTPVQWTLIIILAAVLALVYVFYLWKTGAIDTCQAIVTALAIVGVAILLIGLIFNITALIIIGAVLIVLGVLFMFFEQVCGIGWGILTFIGNLIQTILNIIVSMIAIVIALVINFVTLICNGIAGILNVIKGVCSNIAIAFSNAWHGATASFWDFIADCLAGLKKLEPAINAVAKVFGEEGFTLSGLVEDIRGKADSARDKTQDYVDIGDAWSSGFSTYEYIDIGELGEKTMQTFGTGIEDWSWQEAYKQGSEWGGGVKDSINEWGSKFQDQTDKENELSEKTSWLDKIGNELGLTDTFANMGDFPTEGVDGGYSPDVGKLLNGIGDDTGKIADSMDLTEEDLEYLRRIADMEWKKEYTTASITVDMSNYNTINGDDDLDGIVTKLSDKLYEEMNILANGVYA